MSWLVFTDHRSVCMILNEDIEYESFSHQNIAPIDFPDHASK